MDKPLIINIGILLILMGTGTEACSCVGCSPSQPVFGVSAWTVVLGLVLLVVLVGIAVYCCRRSSRKRNCKALDHAELHPSHKKMETRTTCKWKWAKILKTEEGDY